MNLGSISSSRFFGLLIVTLAAVAVSGLAAAQTAPSAARPASAAPAAATAAPAAAAPAPTTAPPPAAVPAVTAAPAEPAAPARPSVKGVLMNNSVNVRKGPGTEYPVYLTAPLGFEVDAVGQKGAWLEIEFPAKGFSWVSKDYLQKIDDKTGIIISNNVRVRTGPGTQFDIAYTVQVGHKFQVLNMDIKGEWYHVMPMPGETAWILAEYVKLAGPVPGGVSVVPEPEPAGVTTTTTTPPTAPEPLPGTGVTTTREPQPAPQPDLYAAKLADADVKMRAEIAKDKPLDWDLESVSKLYEDIDANATNTVTRAHARNRLAQLKAYQAIQVRAKELGKLDADLEARLKDLEKQRAEELLAIKEPAVTPYLATGTIQKFYITSLGGATHKLLDDKGTIVYLLKSDIVTLSNFEGKICGVKGKISEIPHLPNVRLIEVTNATVL